MNRMLEARTLDANGNSFDLIRKEELQPKGEREQAKQTRNQILGFRILLLTTFVTGIRGDQGIGESFLRCATIVAFIGSVMFPFLENSF